MNRAVACEMPHGFVFGAGSSQNDGKRTRQVGRLRERQVPLPTAMVFGHVRIFFVAHRYLAIWDAHYSADITKIAEKGGIWRRSLNFVVTVSYPSR